MGLPKLGIKGFFKFHDTAQNNVTQEYKTWLENNTAVQIISNVLKRKLERNSRTDRIYLLEARTGSGKSTYMVSFLFESIVKGSRGRLICSQPRVVLTEANANDVLQYNPQYKKGKHMGILSSAQKTKATEQESMNYCTTQILSQTLLKILGMTDTEKIKRSLSKIKLVVVDEVHTLDLPMMSVLKVILDVLDKFGDYPECPMFIFSSATIDTNKMAKYYFQKDPNILENPLVYGFVGGTANFSVEEHFLTHDESMMLNKREEEKKMRDYCFILIAEYVYKNIYPTLFDSTSYLKETQCRDCLIFVPLKSGINVTSNTLKGLIKDKPVFIILEGTEMNQVINWRDKNRNKQRVLIVGYARDYSKAADELLNVPIDPDTEALKFETKIYVSTSILETGKTIYTLYWCVDMGLDTTTINNPLSMDFNNSLKYIKQIPANINQTIQRMGRVGRVAPGNYLHFYSENVYKHFQKSDTAQTINSSNLSGLLLETIRKYKKNSVLDMTAENDYLFPTTSDIILKSSQDLMRSGFLTIYGEFAELLYNAMEIDYWVIYANYFYRVLNFSLFDSLLLAILNKFKLPPIFSISNFSVKSLQIQLESIKNNEEPNLTMIEAIKTAKNRLNMVKYFPQKTFVYIENRLFSDEKTINDL